MYRTSNLSNSELFSTKFNQIWDTFIKTRYYFSIFTLKYGKICIMIHIKYRLKSIVIHIVSLIRNDIQLYCWCEQHSYHSVIENTKLYRCTFSILTVEVFVDHMYVCLLAHLVWCHQTKCHVASTIQNELHEENNGTKFL